MRGRNAPLFLMPRYLIENMTKEEIVKKCGVSEHEIIVNLFPIFVFHTHLACGPPY